MSGRIVGYARVSTTDQHPEEQVDRLKKAGAVKVFTDKGQSGALASRPRWDECLAYLQPGDTLLSTKLDRFGRSVGHLLDLIPDLKARGVELKCLDQSIDTSSALGKMLFTVLAAFAEFEHDIIAERTRDGIGYNRRNGKIKAVRSFGFEKDGVTVRDGEADILRDCAKRLLEGEAQDKIIRELQERNVQTIRGGQWSYTVFRQIMTRPRNAGLLVHNGTVVGRLPEAILTEDEHDRMVALFAGRKLGRLPSGRYLLTGFLYCGCGQKLKGRPKTGTNQKQYWCSTAHPGRVFVNTTKVEDWVADWVISTLGDPQHADQLARAEAETAAELARIDSELAEAEALARAVAARLGAGEITLARYDAVTGPLDARTATLHRMRSELVDGIPAPLPGRRTAADLPGYGKLAVLADWDSADTAGRRAMIARALNGRRIVVRPGTSGKFSADRVSVE